jgi:predicted transcriptional regulator
MRVPCQITQWYLLPAISAEMVRELKKSGVKQAEIARLLGVTPAAVSQYVKGKRGKMVELNAELKKRISVSAKRIASKGTTDEELSREICELCIVARRSRMMCEFHKKIGKFDQTCGLCTGGLNAKH